jgi:hypothetical protein
LTKPGQVIIEKSLLGKMAMDIVDLAIENGDVPLCKRLPEAKRFTIMGLVLILGGYINGCNYVTM